MPTRRRINPWSRTLHQVPAYHSSPRSFRKPPFPQFINFALTLQTDDHEDPD
jgi:hypothetical protein